MAQIFLINFFLPSNTSQLKIEITKFCQLDYEQLYEAWNDLRRCSINILNMGSKTGSLCNYFTMD